MRFVSHKICLLVLACAALLIGRAAEAPSVASVLVWDTLERVIEAKPGETWTSFEFTVTNVSDEPVKIEQIRPTCGCTVAEMPSTPWIIGPHASGTFTGRIDFTAKQGTESKALFVNTSLGTQVLRVSVKIPTVDDAGRRRNQALAQANRQAVFKGDCAKCHVEPAIGRSGSELFINACGVCHLAPERASMVPDLMTARQHRDAEFWRKWIRDGKEGTLMPAWAKEHGGPLTDEQIESLVQFAVRTLPTEPRTGE